MTTSAKLFWGLIPTCLLLSGCGKMGLYPRFTSTKALLKSFDAQGPQQVLVETFNGPIDILTGLGDKVEIKVVKRAGGPSQEEAEDDLENIEVVWEQTGNKVRVQARSINNKSFTDRGASVEIQVPEGSTLNLLTSNGKVSAVGLVGGVEARTSNGAIEAKGSRGELRLQTTNGSIGVEGGSGHINARTSNGSIEIVSNKSVIDAQTSNGRISYAGNLPEGKHVMQTSNGGIQVKLPVSAAFQLDASTSNGRVQSDFGKPEVTERKAKKPAKTSHLSGSFGGDAPAAFLELRCSNGNIEIKRQ